MGINSVPPVWFLLMVGFGARHGNQLTSLKIVSAHLTHLQSATVVKCSALHPPSNWCTAITPPTFLPPCHLIPHILIFLYWASREHCQMLPMRHATSHSYCSTLSKAAHALWCHMPIHTLLCTIQYTAFVHNVCEFGQLRFVFLERSFPCILYIDKYKCFTVKKSSILYWYTAPNLLVCQHTGANHTVY